MKVSMESLILKYKSYDVGLVNQIYQQDINNLNQKIVVLDDDPTGVQTVHNIFVYTDWSIESIRSGFIDKNKMFFILTNSRALTEEQTRTLHIEIAENVTAVAKELGMEFILVSRGDSTLRGHYPLETQVLKDTLEANAGITIDAEIICPFFPEGGRYTINDIHYVADGDSLIPVGLTEFAKDRTFGYKSSNLKEWVDEKSKGAHKKDTIISIKLEELRALDFCRIEEKLLSATNNQKIIVNALSYEDLKIFVITLIRCMNQGKKYIFRTSAALTKVLGGVADKGLLINDELINEEDSNGGLIIIGSHVNKTTRQLELLKAIKSIHFIEFNVRLIIDNCRLKSELERIIAETEKLITDGTTVAVFTSRERMDLNTNNQEDDLEQSVKISNAITSIISSLAVRPNFIIAKGGITSSDVGTKGLAVKKALVMGQILPGVPVWLTGAESKFPNMPYVIFPGNVGNDTALVDVVNKLM